jgi:hypothetical protein
MRWLVTVANSLLDFAARLAFFALWALPVLAGALSSVPVANKPAAAANNLPPFSTPTTTIPYKVW